MIAVSRRQLYEEVWSTPMSQLCKKYGLSDVGMAKVCRKHDIPRPPRGYWAQRQCGQTPARAPLPNPDRDCEIRFSEPSLSQIALLRTGNESERLIANEKQDEMRIRVAATLHGCHELISRAKQVLQTAEVDQHGLIVPPKDGGLCLCVSKASLRRALLILDALLKALDQRGWPVEAGPTATILGVAVGFEILEQVVAKHEQPEEHDLDGPYRFGYGRYDVKRVPSGRLTLRIRDAEMYWARGCRKTWRDGGKQKLEDKLNGFAAGLIALAACKHEHEAELARQEQQRREEASRREAEALRRAELRAKIAAEKARVETLLQRARDWRQSQDLRAFIENVKQRHLASQGEIESGSEMAQWLVWAQQQADRLDPFCESPPSILDEQVEEEAETERRYWRSW